MYKIIYGGKVELMHLTLEGGRRMKDKVEKEQCYKCVYKCILKIVKNNPGKPNTKKLNVKKAKYEVHLKKYIMTLINTRAKRQTFLNNKGNIKKKEKKYILKKSAQKKKRKINNETIPWKIERNISVMLINANKLNSLINS